MVSLSLDENTGWLLENVVFLELLRRNPGDSIYYLRNDAECDFIIKRKNEIKAAYQITYILSENNKKRKISGLEKALRFFGLKKGYILTFEQEDEFKSDSGYEIKVMPVWKWLLSENA